MNRLLQAVDEILHLNICDQEGLQPPTPQQWFDAFNKLAEARKEADQDAQKAAMNCFIPEKFVAMPTIEEEIKEFDELKSAFLAGAQWASSRSTGGN